MQALLEYSVQTYGPLPLELRSRHLRARTNSRPSPYPPTRVVKMTFSPEKPSPKPAQPKHSPAPLQEVAINNNLAEAKSFVEDTSLTKLEKYFGAAPSIRPRVPSSTRRTALGWSKRSTGPKTSNGPKTSTGPKVGVTPKTVSNDSRKENAGQGMMTT